MYYKLMLRKTHSNFLKSPLILLFCLLFVSILTTSVFVEAQEFTTLANNLQKKYQSLSDWQADFIQKTHVDLLGKDIEKKGSLILKKPGKLRIHYKSDPDKYYISNGKKLWVYSVDDPQVDVFKKISPHVAKEGLTFLGGLGNLFKEFKVQGSSKGKNFIELIPKNSDSSFEKIILGVDKKNYLVEEMILLNQSGNRTNYRFFNTKTNIHPDDKLFEFEKIKGMREINH